MKQLIAIILLAGALRLWSLDRLPPGLHYDEAAYAQAAHEMRLGQTLVAFELKRCRRRSIGMVVSPEGLSVRAPRWATWSDIEQALQDTSARRPTRLILPCHAEDIDRPALARIHDELKPAVPLRVVRLEALIWLEAPLAMNCTGPVVTLASEVKLTWPPDCA